MAAQSPANVAITGGSITGITDLAIADGGTAASTASGARTNLGLGDVAVQSAAAVNLTGGSITGLTTLGFGTYTAGVVAQAGYITVKDSGGTTRRLLVG
jgi:hypothetical protein